MSLEREFQLQQEVRELRQQLADRDEQISDLTISSDTYFAERNSARDVWRRASKDRDELRQQLAVSQEEIEENKIEFDNKLAMQFRDIAHYKEQLAAALADSSTAWAQAHRLALELECLIMDTKDNAIVSKWWDSAFEAMEEYNNLKPGAAEDAEAWAKMRKAGI